SKASQLSAMQRPEIDAGFWHPDDVYKVLPPPDEDKEDEGGAVFYQMALTDDDDNNDGGAEEEEIETEIEIEIAKGPSPRIMRDKDAASAQGATRRSELKIRLEKATKETGAPYLHKFKNIRQLTGRMDDLFFFYPDIEGDSVSMYEGISTIAVPKG